MSEADIIIVGAAIVVMGVLVAGVVANAKHRHEDRRRFGSAKAPPERGRSKSPAGAGPS
jgi:hypothetical protein